MRLFILPLGSLAKVAVHFLLSLLQYSSYSCTTAVYSQRITVWRPRITKRHTFLGAYILANPPGEHNSVNMCTLVPIVDTFLHKPFFVHMPLLCTYALVDIPVCRRYIFVNSLSVEQSLLYLHLRATRATLGRILSCRSPH